MVNKSETLSHFRGLFRLYGVYSEFIGLYRGRKIGVTINNEGLTAAHAELDLRSPQLKTKPRRRINEVEEEKRQNGLKLFIFILVMVTALTNLPFYPGKLTKIISDQRTVRRRPFEDEPQWMFD